MICFMLVQFFFAKKIDNQYDHDMMKRSNTLQINYFISLYENKK